MLGAALALGLSHGVRSLRGATAAVKGIFDRRVPAQGDVTGEVGERGLWRQPDELGARDRSVAGDGGDDGSRRRPPVVLHVGRNLGEPDLLQPQTDRPDAGKALLPALADPGGDRPSVARASPPARARR